MSNVDTFLSRFNHSNIYKDGNTELKLGNYVTIQDGTYNVAWEIAGFDMEHNRTAADGTVYDNGYGICLVPKNMAKSGYWHSGNSIEGGYISSTVHTSELPTIVSNLQNVLGSHIVTRNVLLSNGVDGSYHSNGYTWTTAKATLMSVGQLTGTFAANWNKYDDGEANYKLPVFDAKDYYTTGGFLTRGIWGLRGPYRQAWHVDDNGTISNVGVNGSWGIRPIIYIR